MGIADRLQDYLDGVTERVLPWRVANCCHYVANWVQAERGVVGLLPWDIRTAVVLKRQLGIEALATSRFGCAAVPARESQVGDPVLLRLPRPGRWSMGICAGRAVAFLAPGGGITYVPRELCSMAWPLERATGPA